MRIRLTRGLSKVVVLYGFITWAFPGQIQAQEETPFVRGEVNQDGFVDVGDAVTVLLHQFKPFFEAPCEKAVDVDDSGTIDITDAVWLLAYLFQDGPPPLPPFGRCGLDPTPDPVGCAETSCDDVEGTLIFSEIMASNFESLPDEDGDSSDWIEIHMPQSASVESVDLGGWYLTGNPALLRTWKFPDGITMRRGDFLVVFASGKDRSVAGSELHANFSMNKNGEYLALVAPDGLTVVDEFAPFYPEQLTDISYGLAQSTSALIAVGDQALYHVPTASDSGLGDSWADPGFSPNGWKTGRMGLGFSGFATEGFEVTYIKANVSVSHLNVAEDVLDNPARQRRVVTATASIIDYYNSGGRGNYSNDSAFPGLTFADVNDFVVHVTGTVMIPATGSWSFGVNSDDGFSLQLTNGVQTHTMEHPTPRGPGDTVRVFNFTRAGPYELTLLFYERGGGAHVELFAAQGNHPSFNGNDFRLVGDTARGGLGLLGFAADIRTDLASEMRNVNASLWTRMSFEVDDVNLLGGLALRMRYEDGFVAYLNGAEVARRNAPGSLQWNSSAPVDRPIEDVPIVEEINLTGHLGRLENGPNVLAIHALNNSAADADFLVQPELVAAGRAEELQYMSTPTPGTFNVSGSIDFVRSVDFDADRGFYDGAFPLTLETVTPGSQIRYTLDGSTPTPTHGTVYTGPIDIDGTTVVRAMGYRANHLDSGVGTRTYIYVSDVKRQSPGGQAPGAGWPAGSVNGQILNYGMDPDVVNNARWAGQIENALLAIPSISLVTDLGNLFGSSTGIYVNARSAGRSWERRTSIELLHADGTEGFGLDGGLRIRGAFSRSGDNPKHSFRLYFRNEYGAGKLKYPLFDGEGVDEFDKVDLRTSQNYSWAFQGSDQNTFLRDVFSRDVERDMRQPYTRSRYYHLYINGHYWGLYQTEERADADFAESYLGGDKDDYDVIKNDSSGSRALHATDGTMQAYRRLYDAAVAGFSSNTAYFRVQGLKSDGSPNPNGEKLLDPENLMDYMICTYYTGDPDAPISAWGHISNNVFAIYNRMEPDGFTWYRHDAEHSLGANGGLNEARLLTDPTDRTIGQQWRHFNPAWLHVRLTVHREYRMQFADRVNRYFFNDGVLSSGGNIDRWMERANQISLAVIGASARWGDSKRGSPRTRDDWQREINYMRTTYFPRRTQIVLNQMRSVNMFPKSALVRFNQHGGEVSPGFQVTMSQSNGTRGTIYYTVDGFDPRQSGGGVDPIAETYEGAIDLDETTTVRARVRAGAEWGAMTEARFTIGLEGLVINEFMASNGVTLEDPDEAGEFPDWIEVYNGTSAVIDLGSMYLTDDPLDLTHWQIAPGVSIVPGEYLIFYADDDGTQGALHTNYQLSISGEFIGLVDKDGMTIIDSISFNRQVSDVSFGRFPDGADTWDFHQGATPGAPNQPHLP